MGIWTGEWRPVVSLNIASQVRIYTGEGSRYMRMEQMVKGEQKVSKGVSEFGVKDEYN